MAFYLAYLLAFYLAYLLALYLAYLMAFYLAYLLALSWEGPRLKSSGAGPAIHPELGRSQAEVPRCAPS
jgi:hypothetical protein